MIRPWLRGLSLVEPHETSPRLLQKMGKNMKMSEARLNDYVYITLKKLLFEPMFGEDVRPRECDIRVCMNLIVPDTIKNPAMAGILLPNEVAPASHTKQYDVDLNEIFEECIAYIEDHWLKVSIEEAWQNNSVRTSMRDYFDNMIVPIVAAVPEDKCAVTISMSDNDNMKH